MLIGFAVGTLEYLVRFSMLVVSCLCTCTSRIKAEIADAIDDADRAQVAGIDLLHLCFLLRDFVQHN